MRGMLRACLISILAFVEGCQTAPPKVDITPTSADGSWEAKALVVDRRKNKSNTLSVDFVARQPRQMRMEVTTTIGVHLASFVLNGDRVAYSLSRERRFVTGPAEAAMMRDLIAMAIDPKVILDLLFDRMLNPTEWNCQVSETRLPQSCVNSNLAAASNGLIRIDWSERSQHKRVVKIQAPSADVTLVLREISSKVEIKDSLFTLQAPVGFRTVKVE